jgi:hypothetical protein
MNVDAVIELPLLDQLKNLADNDDADVACRRLVEILVDARSYKEIMGWRGEAAQYLINLLQTVRLRTLLNILF